MDQGAAQVQGEELERARAELASLKRTMGEGHGRDLWPRDL